MATAYEADITDLVKPYMDKARLEGELKGKLETARKMKGKGFTNSEIQDITGLLEKELNENGIL